MESHRKVAEVVNTLGSQWKEDLPALCERLDAAEASVSKAWRKQGRNSWVEALDVLPSEDIIKAVNYRLAQVRKASKQTFE